MIIMKAINLKTEYLINPIGMDIRHPRLMWNCEGGTKQTAYRVVAKTDGQIVWDSGKVVSESMHADDPNDLVSRQRVEWSVTLWDENDSEGEPSETASFETGLLSAGDFRAKWISGDYRVNKKKRYPVDCFKKAFSARNVAKARLYITACGLYCEDRKTFQCHPSYATIGEAVNMSNNTVAKHVEGLVRKGLITTERTTVKTRDGRTHNGSLLYTLCPLAPVEQAYFEKQIQEATARLNFKAALEKYEKRKGGA